MPRRCSICQHSEREAIEHAIVGGESFRGIARRFAVSPDAVERHAGAHVPAALARASEAAAVVHGDNLAQAVRDLESRALGILERAEKRGDVRGELGAIREARECLTLLARLLGDLADRAVEIRVQRELDAGLDRLERALPADLYHRVLEVIAGEEPGGANHAEN